MFSDKNHSEEMSRITRELSALSNAAEESEAKFSELLKKIEEAQAREEYPMIDLTNVLSCATKEQFNRIFKLSESGELLFSDISVNFNSCPIEFIEALIQILDSAKQTRVRCNVKFYGHFKSEDNYRTAFDKIKGVNKEIDPYITFNLSTHIERQGDHQDAFCAFMDTVVKNSAIEALSLSGFCLENLDKEIFLKKMEQVTAAKKLSSITLFDCRFFSDGPVGDRDKRYVTAGIIKLLQCPNFKSFNIINLNLNLKGSQFWKLGAQNILEIATALASAAKAPNTLSCTLFDQDEVNSDAASAEIASWTDAEQLDFARAQLLLFLSKWKPGPIFHPSIKLKFIQQGVMEALEKDLSLVSKLEQWLTLHPCLKEIDQEFIKKYAQLCLEKDPGLFYWVNRIEKHFSYLAELNLAFKSLHKWFFDLSIVNSKGRYSGYLNLTYINKSADMEVELKTHLREKIAILSKIDLQVTFSDHSQQELDYLAQLINQLILPKTHFVLQELSISTNGIRRLLEAINKVSHSRIQSIALTYSALGTVEPLSFLQLMKSISTKEYVEVNLSGNQLSTLGENVVLQGIDQLKHSKALRRITLDNNGLCNLGMPFIDGLIGANNNDKIVVQLFAPSKPDSIESKAILDFYGTLNLDEKSRFVRYYYRQILRPQIDGVQIVIEDVVNLEVEEQHKNIVVDTLVMAITESDMLNYNLANAVLMKLNLSSETLLEFFKKLVAKSFEAFYDFIVIFKGTLLKLEAAQRVELYVYSFQQYSLGNILLVDCFDLYSGQDQAARLLSAWKGVFRPFTDKQLQDLSEEAFSQDSEELDVYEEDIIAQNIVSLYMPAFEKACQTVWPNSSFATDCIKDIYKYIETHDVINEDFFPLLNMTSWFSWVLLKLTKHEELMNQLTNQAVSQHQDEVQGKAQKKTLEKPAYDFKAIFKTVLREILAFASPEARYKLSLIFLDQICQDKEQHYFAITNNCSVGTLLPAIPLCQIVLQDYGLLDSVKSLLAKVSFSEYEGHHYRALVSGLIAISQDGSLEPLQKLRIIEEILGKTDIRKKCELKTEDLVNLFKMEKGDDNEEERVRKERQSLSKEKALFQKKPKSQEKDLEFLNDKNDKIEKLDLRMAELDSNLGAIASASEKQLRVKEKKVADLCLSLEALEQTLYEKIKTLLPTRLLNKHDFRKLKKHLLEGVIHAHFKESEFKQRISYLLMVQGFASLGVLQELSNLLQGAFNEKSREVFQRMFELEPSRAEWYDKTFGICRNETALLTYLSKVKSLNASDQEKLFKAFRSYVQSVLSKDSEDFYKMRYRKQDSVHLDTVFYGRALLKVRWERGYYCSFNEFLRKNKIVYQEFVPNFTDFVKKKIFGHKHIDPQHYGKLKQYLEAQNDEERQAALTLAERLASTQGNLPSRSKEITLTSDELQLVSQRYHAIIQLNLIKLLETRVNHEEEISKKFEAHLKLLRNINSSLRQLANANQFTHDIEALIKGLKGNHNPPKFENYSGWTISDTDHYWDLEMSGTDIEGSCQNVGGSAHLNKCLMAYTNDGKNRMLAIQDAKRFIKARCIFRILWDHQNEKPVLFMEEIYPDTLRPDYRQALEIFAVQRAQALNLTLLTAESTLSSYQYKGSVESLGSVAPWEYVDAIFSEVEGGVFQIPEAQVIYEPDPRPDLVPGLLESRVAVIVPEPQSPHEHNNNNNQRSGSVIGFAWQSWKQAYKAEHPDSEKLGYGAGTLILRN